MVFPVVVVHQEAEMALAVDVVLPADVVVSVVDAAADSAVVVAEVSAEVSAADEVVDSEVDVVVLVVVAVDSVAEVADVVATKLKQSATCQLYRSGLLYHHHIRSGIVSFHLLCICVSIDPLLRFDIRFHSQYPWSVVTTWSTANLPFRLRSVQTVHEGMRSALMETELENGLQAC